MYVIAYLIAYTVTSATACLLSLFFIIPFHNERHRSEGESAGFVRVQRSTSWYECGNGSALGGRRTSTILSFLWRPSYKRHISTRASSMHPSSPSCYCTPCRSFATTQGTSCNLQWRPNVFSLPRSILPVLILRTYSHASCCMERLPSKRGLRSPGLPDRRSTPIYAPVSQKSHIISLIFWSGFINRFSKYDSDEMKLLVV